MTLPTDIAALPLPLAAGWVDALGPLLVVAFWVIRQVMVGLKEQRDLERAREEAAQRGEKWPPDDEPEPIELRDLEPEAPAVPGPQQQPQPAARPAQADLRSEVEEFLRRAANQGQPPAQAPEPAPRPKPPLDPFEEPARKPTRRQPQPKPKVVRPPVRPPAVEPAPEAPLAPVGSRPLRHLPESQLAEQAAHLGEGIVAADNRADARLHEKFDHRLGNLGDRPGEKPSAVGEPAGAASRIRKMLASPGGVREAVILSEVLRRPADRL